MFTSMRYVLRLILTLGAAFTFLSQQSCRLGRSDSSELEISGGTPNEDKFPATVGLLNQPGGDICTGTFIRSDLIMTAGHCVHGQEKILLISKHKALVQKSSTQVEHHPQYKLNSDGSMEEENTYADIGFVRFPAGTAPDNLIASLGPSPKVGDSVELVGYGENQGAKGKEGLLGTRRHGRNKVAEINTKYNVIVLKAGNQNGKPSYGEGQANLAPGDSGGALYNSQGKIVGIASSASPEDSWYVDVNYPKSRSYIDKVAGTATSSQNSDMPRGTPSPSEGQPSQQPPSAPSASPGASSSDYLPQCKKDGYKGGGFTLSYVQKSGSVGFMKKSSGSGFSCKAQPATGGDQSLPQCRVACPNETANMSGEWGWCARTEGYDCRQ